MECRVLLLANLLMRSQFPKEYQFQEAKVFISQLSEEIVSKRFNGTILDRPEFDLSPEYSSESSIDYGESMCTMISFGINAYTGLFGIIVALAVLFSIKNR